MPRKWPRHFVIRPSGFYFQATPAMRRGGIVSEALGKDMTAAVVRARALNAAWDEIRRGLEPVTRLPAWAGTFSYLMEQLRKSAEWKDKAPATIADIEYAFGIIEPIFGTYDLKQITPTACGAFYGALRDQGSVHRAAKVLKWMRYLFNFGLRFQLVDNNPTMAVKIKHSRPRQAVWTTVQIEAVITKAQDEGRPCIALAVQIAYATALRQADVLALTWGQFEGDRLVLTQAKTSKDISCPLSSETIAMMQDRRQGTLPLATAPIIRGPHGRAYKKDNFTHRFRDICRAAGVPDDLQFKPGWPASSGGGGHDDH